MVHGASLNDSVTLPDVAMTVRVSFQTTAIQCPDNVHPKAIIANLVQLFYAWRIRVVTESWLLVGVITFCSFCQWCKLSSYRTVDL